MSGLKYCTASSDEIFIVGDPRGQPRAEPALPQSMKKVRQLQLRMHQKVIGKVGVAGDVQFKRIVLHQLPVHHNAHTAIVFRRYDAYQQNTIFGRHWELPNNSVRGIEVVLKAFLGIVVEIQTVTDPFSESWCVNLHIDLASLNRQCIGLESTEAHAQLL